MRPLPEMFEDRMRVQLKDDFTRFIDSMQEPPPVSIRLHPLKRSGKEPHPLVPWSPSGRYLPARPSFTLDPLFHGGSYYVQEASSMFLECALRQSTDLSAPLNILDLCAAPGGKSTHILSLITRDSLLVSNEVIRPRASILSENVQKWGYPNCIVTQNDPADFRKLPGFFDVVVIDAPCSGEGLFRKDPQAMEEWSPENVQLCCGRQKRIIADAWEALREDGVLIYCTCTYSALENEENLKWLKSHYRAEPVQLSPDPAWRIEEVTAEGMTGYRFFPHRLMGEGFFLSAIRKKDSAGSFRMKTKGGIARPLKSVQERLRKWILHPDESAFFQFNDLLFFVPASRAAESEFLLQQLKIVYAGTNLGSLKHEKIVPDHALALSVELRREAFPELPLGEPEALTYLRKEALAPHHGATGFTLVTFEGLPVGWVNALASRMNNLYPQEWRIRKKPSDP